MPTNGWRYSLTIRNLDVKFIVAHNMVLQPCSLEVCNPHITIIYMDCLLWGQASKKTLNMYTCMCIHGLAPWGHTTLKMFQSPEDDGPVLDGSVENTQWPSGWEVVQLEYHVWYYMGVLSLRVKSLLESLKLLTTRSYPIPIGNYEDTPGTIYSFVASDLVAARSRRPHCQALGSQRWRWSHVLRHRQSSGRI